MRHISRSARCAAVLVSSAGGTLAHTFDVPESVVANPDGSFSYETVFTVGPGSAILLAYYWIGVDNVTSGFFADCFCIPDLCDLEEGEIIIIPVDGSLLDPAQSGIVEQGVELCDEPSFVSLTTVLPFTIPVGELPTVTALRFTHRPNPVSAQATFHVTPHERGTVFLHIFDATGRLVATPADGLDTGGGVNTVVWDVRGADGARVREGVYFARLEVGGVVATRRLVVAR